MRKLPKEYENPIDDIILKYIVDPLCPFFKSLNFVPNDLTTLSLIFGLLSIYFLWNYNLPLFAISYEISYIFDCFDGHYARKYNMVTTLGDIYDHVKDTTVFVLLLFVCFYRYKVRSETRVIFICLLVIAIILMLSAMGCQEKLYNKDESDTLLFTKHLCPGDALKNIHYTKLFGCGTFYVIVILLCFFLNYNKIS